jgi:hypothetical protein
MLSEKTNPIDGFAGRQDQLEFYYVCATPLRSRMDSSTGTRFQLSSVLVGSSALSIVLASYVKRGVLL